MFLEKNVSMTQTLCQKVIRKTYLSRSVSNDSIQTQLLDPYMFVLVVTRHGSGKVCFNVEEQPYFSRK